MVPGRHPPGGWGGGRNVQDGFEERREHQAHRRGPEEDARVPRLLPEGLYDFVGAPEQDVVGDLLGDQPGPCLGSEGTHGVADGRLDAVRDSGGHLTHRRPSLSSPSARAGPRCHSSQRGLYRTDSGAPVGRSSVSASRIDRVRRYADPRAIRQLTPNRKRVDGGGTAKIAAPPNVKGNVKNTLPSGARRNSPFEPGGTPPMATIYGTVTPKAVDSGWSALSRNAKP